MIENLVIENANVKAESINEKQIIDLFFYTLDSILNETEKQFLQLLTDGLTKKQISETLNLDALEVLKTIKLKIIGSTKLYRIMRNSSILTSLRQVIYDF